MKIYNYDKDTKELINATDASINPLRTSEYLIPANATTIDSIAPKEGYTIVFNEANRLWEHIEDNRGAKVYSTSTGEESTIDYIGSIKDGFTTIEPKDFETWNGTSWEVDSVAKAEHEAMVAKESKQNSMSTLVVTTASGNTFDANDTSRANMNEAIQAASFLGLTSSMWKLADNTIIDVSVDEIKEALALGIQAKGKIILG